MSVLANLLDQLCGKAHLPSCISCFRKRSISQLDRCRFWNLVGQKSRASTHDSGAGTGVAGLLLASADIQASITVTDLPLLVQMEGIIESTLSGSAHAEEHYRQLAAVRRCPGALVGHRRNQELDWIL